MEQQNEPAQLDRLLTPREVAAYLHLSENTLYQYRALGIGPHYIKLDAARLIRYRQSDVDAWLEKQKVEMAENEEK